MIIKIILENYIIIIIILYVIKKKSISVTLHYEISYICVNKNYPARDTVNNY